MFAIEYVLRSAWRWVATLHGILCILKDSWPKVPQYLPVKGRKGYMKGSFGSLWKLCIDEKLCVSRSSYITFSFSNLAHPQETLSRSEAQWANQGKPQRKPRSENNSRLSGEPQACWLGKLRTLQSSLEGNKVLGGGTTRKAKGQGNERRMW